nr:Isocitrate isopropylmalate dehydrogenase domain containing protein [Haemonchus contortus]
MLVKCLGKVGPISQMGSRALSTDVRRVVLIPGDGIGPEISKSVQEIFEAAKTPVEWDPVDVTPVKGRDGVFRIPSRCIELMHTNKNLEKQLAFNVSTMKYEKYDYMYSPEALIVQCVWFRKSKLTAV